MYRVMVVDDEPLVRLAVRSLENWEAHGFIIDLEAANGKQALALLEENTDIDIIITDISMPIMNGLEFISEVVSRGLETKIIVLSTYNDYDWVRQAFKLGVGDYILKTQMEPEGILKLLNSLAQEIDGKKTKKSSEINQNIRYQKEIILKSAIGQEDMELDIEQVINSGLRLNGKNMAVCYLWVDDYQTVLERYNNSTLKSFTQTVLNSIYQVLSEINIGEALYLSPQEYVMILSFEDASQKQIREKIIDVLWRVKHALKNYVSINVTLGISDIRFGFDNLKLLFEQSRNNARLRFVLGKGKIIFPEDVERITGKVNQSLIGKEAKFINALRECESDKVLVELDRLIEIIKINIDDRIEKIYSNYMELIFITVNYLNEVGKEVEEVFGKNIDFYEKILQFETQEELNIWIRNIVTWVVNFIEENKSIKLSRSVIGAKEFIKNNYSNDNLTLKMVSDYTQLSESYFSAIFAKEMGESFIDYLTKVRIEKAKELMTTTNLKIYQICDKVGYTNTEHFSRVFKKIVGYSPKNYKR